MGQFLRHRLPDPHICDRPREAHRGAVWLCDCGRRWTATQTSYSFGGPEWQRRYWPWPRRPKPHPGDFIVPVSKPPSAPATPAPCGRDGLVDVDTEQLVGKGGGHTIPKNLPEEPDNGAPVNFNG
jgi:hypothetical protein